MSVTHDSWQRRGFSLLWGPESFAQFAKSDEAVTLREFFNMSGQWPDDLPSAHGDALVVVGLEGCLDTLTPRDAEQWLREDFKSYVLRFQSEYENQKALIFWLPGGRARVTAAPASEEYLWVCAGQHTHEVLPLGRCLWAGAESDAKRIISATERNADADGPAWAGLYHPRIS